jgi:hypothetical protein
MSSLDGESLTGSEARSGGWSGDGRRGGRPGGCRVLQAAGQVMVGVVVGLVVAGFYRRLVR